MTELFQYSFNHSLIYLFYRHVAIKEIVLDPNKKSRTKEAVLKEARYKSDRLTCHLQMFN